MSLPCETNMLFFFFLVLWMRGKFTTCIAYRLSHWCNIYGFDQGFIELCTCGVIKFIEQFLCIIIFFAMNFVPNLHYKEVNVTGTLQYEFVYGSNQERCQLK